MGHFLRVQLLLQDPKQGAQAASGCKTQLPRDFQEKVLKNRIGERGCRVCDQLVDVFLIGSW